MATSRTGTAEWKAIRTRMLRRAKRDGVDHCPICGVLLDYTPGIRARNSPEVDHVTSVAQGGTDDIEQLQVICGHCNRRLGDKKPKKPRSPRKRPSIALETTRDW